MLVQFNDLGLDRYTFNWLVIDDKEIIGASIVDP